MMTSFWNPLGGRAGWYTQNNFPNASQTYGFVESPDHWTLEDNNQTGILNNRQNFHLHGSNNTVLGFNLQNVFIGTALTNNYMTVKNPQQNTLILNGTRNLTLGGRNNTVNLNGGHSEEGGRLVLQGHYNTLTGSATNQADTLYLGGSNNAIGNYAEKQYFNMGDGDDTVKVSGMSANNLKAAIDLGAGNDSVTLDLPNSVGSNITNSKLSLRGGEGIDTLNLNAPYGDKTYQGPLSNLTFARDGNTMVITDSAGNRIDVADFEKLNLKYNYDGAAWQVRAGVYDGYNHIVETTIDPATGNYNSIAYRINTVNGVDTRIDLPEYSTSGNVFPAETGRSIGSRDTGSTGGRDMGGRTIETATTPNLTAAPEATPTVKTLAEEIDIKPLAPSSNGASSTEALLEKPVFKADTLNAQPLEISTEKAALSAENSTTSEPITPEATSTETDTVVNNTATETAPNEPQQQEAMAEIA